MSKDIFSGLYGYRPFVNHKWLPLNLSLMKLTYNTLDSATEFGTKLMEEFERTWPASLHANFQMCIYNGGTLSEASQYVILGVGKRLLSRSLQKETLAYNTCVNAVAIPNQPTLVI